MNRLDKRKRKAVRRSNLRRHGALNASANLPESHDTRFARRLIFTVLTTLLAVIIWAGNTPVNEIINGNGVIQTRTLAERLEHPDGGLVSEIYASKGQRVIAGASILRFDTSSLVRELSKLHASQVALEAERSRIAFLLDDTGTVPDFNSLSDLEPDELLFWVEQTYLTAQLDLIEAAARTSEAAKIILRARRDNLTEESGLLAGRLKRSRQGVKTGAIARNSVEQVEREDLQLQRALLELEGDIAAQDSAIETNLLQKAELLASRRRDAALRRAEIQEKIVSVALSIAEIEARIERSDVVASVTGTIMDMAVANPQEIIAPGDMIAEIVPDSSAVEAEIEISADRIGNIELGMEARVKVLSYDFTRFGEIVGHVAAISPSSFENETGQTVFRVKVALPNEGVNAELIGRPVRPGMTVTADILTDSKKVLTYLLKPLRVLGDRAFSEA
ncbi:HlyD family type I secretion periplasmic adaptor subunit [Rhodobacteraceae bacterium]|nr:HlyD family type I secretion periplasmic adaptor subunit [Paracoccaceae bacterium]